MKLEAALGQRPSHNGSAELFGPLAQPEQAKVPIRVGWQLDECRYRYGTAIIANPYFGHGIIAVRQHLHLLRLGIFASIG
jgi:hypothetical protein